MRERDIDRKLFHRGHYEILAKRFREALEPLFSDDYEDREERVGNMVRVSSGKSRFLVDEAARVVVVKLAMDLAFRLSADNSEFDPKIFLDRCSPDPVKYPLATLWAEYMEAQNARVPV